MPRKDDTMSNINTALGGALQKFTFTDNEGEVIASFRLNPTDIRLAARLQEAAKYFEESAPQIAEEPAVADMLKLNNELEEKICYILGYDARESLFGLLSATTILPDGEIFCFKVVDAIANAVAPEVEKRQKAMQKVRKYTEKYT